MSMNVRRGWCSFLRDEDDSEAWLASLSAYAAPEIRNSAFTREWLTQMANHMANLTRDEGLFLDNTVTRTRWRATWRRTRMVVYRWLRVSRRTNRPRKRR